MKEMINSIINLEYAIIKIIHSCSPCFLVNKNMLCSPNHVVCILGAYKCVSYTFCDII